MAVENVVGDVLAPQRGLGGHIGLGVIIGGS